MTHQKAVSLSHLERQLVISWGSGEPGQTPAMTAFCAHGLQRLWFNKCQTNERHCRGRKIYLFLKDRELPVIWTDVVCQLTHYLDMEGHQNVIIFWSKWFLQLWLGFSDPPVLDFRWSLIFMSVPNCTTHSKKNEAAQFHQLFFFHFWATVGKKTQFRMTRHMFLSMLKHILISSKVGHHCLRNLLKME